MTSNRLILPCYRNTGIIEKTVMKIAYEKTHIEWRIPDFGLFLNSDNLFACYESPYFIVNGVLWFLCIYPKTGPNFEFLKVLVKADEKPKSATEYTFRLKKSDSSTEDLTSGILEEKPWNAEYLFKRSDLLQRKSELTTQDVFTLICKLKYEISHSTQSTVSEETKIPKLLSLDALSENFKDLFGDKETCDTSLNVKDKEYKAHRSVLIARSNVFAATFKHDTLERQTGVITILDCDPDSFEMFLMFLYSGRLEEISYRSALNLYYTSNKYDIEELKAFCIEYLMQNVTEENICEVAVFADKYDETALLSAVQEFFNKNARNIFLTSEWKCFMKENNRLASKLLIEMSNVKLKD